MKQLANEKQDEEYLETLLNSVISSDNEEDYLDETDIEHDVEEAVLEGNQDIEKSEPVYDDLEAFEDLGDKEESEHETQDFSHEFQQNSEEFSDSKPEIPETEEEDLGKWLEDELKKDDLNGDLDIDDVLLNEELNEIDEIINSMYSGEADMLFDQDSTLKEENADNGFEDVGFDNDEQSGRSDTEDYFGMPDNLSDIDNLINQDTKSSEDIGKKGKKGKKAKKENKDSFFKKLFSHKEETKDIEEGLNENNILSETGSTAEDMEYLGLKNNMDISDDIEEKDTKKKKKKEKKKNTNAKKRNPKEKKIKVKKKKEKPLVREEIIKISPVSMVFIMTIIVAVIMGVYFGSTIFSYNSKMNQASSYYVDREYSKAYDILAGMDLKKSDEGFYNQVINIMKVEKCMNDFQSYLEIGYYSNALEALIKGVENFDGNIGVANELGTVEILNSILNNIDTALQNYYGMTVEEVRNILQNNSKTELSRIINQKAAGIRIGGN